MNSSPCKGLAASTAQIATVQCGIIIAPSAHAAADLFSVYLPMCTRRGVSLVQAQVAVDAGVGERPDPA